MEMMDNTKCKDQCQDDSPCVWPRDLNNPGKISIDKCIPPTMELKGNGNKERKETGKGPCYTCGGKGHPA